MEYHHIDLLVGAVTGLIMFSVGLGLTSEDFQTNLPVSKSAWNCIDFSNDCSSCHRFYHNLVLPYPNRIQNSLIILAASPGGATSGIITYLLRGNIALSISLTAINSFLTLFSIPIIVNAALILYLGNLRSFASCLQTMLQIFTVTILPSFCGLLFRRYFEKTAIKVEKTVKYIMIILLLIVFIIKFFANESQGGVNFVRSDYFEILPFALLLNIVCLLFGYFFLRTFNLPHADSVTSCIESGVHNTPMAILVAGTLLANEQMVKPILLYALFSFWTALLIGYLINKQFSTKEYSDK